MDVVAVAVGAAGLTVVSVQVVTWFVEEWQGFQIGRWHL